jgi:fibronectin-binding autotransporter adhesin
VVAGGAVTKINITNPGSGYVSAPVVVIDPPDDATATATALLSNPDGFLPYATISGPNSAFDFASYYPGDNGSVGIGAYTGYVTAATGSTIAAAKKESVATARQGTSSGLSLQGTSLAAANGVIQVASGGSGYTAVPNVTISGGGGTGATAVATLSGGTVRGITLTSGGSGYTSIASIVITIDPPLGDVVKETATTDSVPSAGATLSGLLLDNPNGTTITLGGSLTLTSGAIAAAGTTGSTAVNNTFAPSGSASIIVPNVASASGGASAEALLMAGNNTTTTLNRPFSVAAPAVSGLSVTTAGTGTGTNPGTWAFKATNAYTGGTTIGSGIVRITANTALGASTGRDTVIGGASLVVPATADGLTIAQPLTLNGLGANEVGALSIANPTSNTWSGAITLSSPSAIGVASRGTLNTGTGAIAGAGNDLIKFGDGTLALRATSSDNFAHLIVDGGNVATGGSGALTANIPVVLDPGTTLIVNAAVTAGGLALNGGATVAGNSTLTLAGDLSTSGTGNQITNTAAAGLAISGSRIFSIAPAGTGAELSLSSVVSGTGAITKIGAGTLVYTGSKPNTNSGVLTVAEGPFNFSKTAQAFAGPLVIGNFSNNRGVSDIVAVTTTSDQLNGHPVTINSSGELLIPSGATTVGALTLNGGQLVGPVTGTLMLGGNVTAISASTPSGVVSSSISGNLTLGAARTISVGDANASAATASGTPTAAVALAVLSGDSVGSISVVDGGAGYTSPPRVTISGGGGSGAAATAVLNNGVVTQIDVSSGGSGYTSQPTVTISPSPPIAAAAAVTLVNGTIPGVLTVANGGITNPGAGYLGAPHVTVSGGGVTGATATAVVTNGSVERIDITPTTGYTSLPTLIIDPPDVAATATAQINPGIGSITAISVINAGAGYTAPPTVVLEGGGGSYTSATTTINGFGHVTGVTVTGSTG